MVRHQRVLIVTHHDADGVSSAGVLVRALEALGKNYDVKILPQLYPDILGDLPLGDYDFVFFTDFGGKHIDDISSHVDNFLVVDHHNTDTSSKNLLHPLHMNYDPDLDASASTLSALVSYHLNPDPKTLAYGLIGASGDQQIREGAFSGLNRVFVRTCLKEGIITVYKDLVLPGIRVKDLPWVLYYSTDPYLPGLTGDEEGIYDLLERSGILSKSSYGRVKYLDLGLEERRLLFTNLSLHLLRSGWSSQELKQLIGEVYEINGNVGWTSTVRTYSSLLNAVGKQGKTEVAINLLLDHFEYLPDAEQLLLRYRRILVDAITKAKERALDMDILVLFTGNIPHYTTGTVAEALRREYGKTSLVITREGNYLKASFRGEDHLDVVSSRCAEKVGGEGGGHPQAAGARILPESRDDFIDCAVSLLKELQSKG